MKFIGAGWFLDEAMNLCRDDHGGYLPLPLNDQENDEYFNAFITLNLDTFINYDYDIQNQGKGVALDLVRDGDDFIRFSNNEQVLFFNWNTESGEPDNGWDPYYEEFWGEEHVAMLTSLPESTPNEEMKLGTWNDFSDFEDMNVVCEADS